MKLALIGAITVLAIVVLYRMWRWIRVEVLAPSFISSGFEYARCGPYEGWLSRDPQNNDWIIWSTKEQRMYRGPTADAFHWVASPESRNECIKIGKEYARQRRRNRMNTVR